MIHLIAEPAPSDYEIFVIQIVSLAYVDWVDYQRLSAGTPRDLAERQLDDHASLYPGRRFRLVKRQIQDTVVT